MPHFKSLINTLFFAITFVVVTSCVPKATEKKAVCGINEAFNNVSRSCYSITAPNKAPVAINITPTAFNEDGSSIITLSYTDADIDLATACQVTGLTNITVTTPCACSGAGVCTVGVTGTANYNGSAQFSYTVKSTTLVSNTATASLTISSVNDAPAISTSAQTTNEDTVKAVAFTIADVDTTLGSCSSRVSVLINTNPLLAPSIVITGTAPNCIATITPGANLFGSSNITLQVTDGALTAASLFNFAVTAVNDAPVMATFVANTPTNEDTATTISFTLSDVEEDLLLGLDCSATYLSASTSNTLVIPIINIVFSGSYPNCIATITPLDNVSNTFSNITIIAKDTVPAISTSNAFRIDVTAVNDAPVISAIADTSTNEDVVKAVNFTISDVDNTLVCSSLTGSMTVTTNDNPTLISSVIVTGTAPNCTVTMTPAPYQGGSVSNIVLTVADNSGLSNAEGFEITVNSTNNEPTFPTSFSVVKTNEGGAIQSDGFIIDEDFGSSADENTQGITITSIASDNTGVLPLTGITLFYDENDNGVKDTLEGRLVGARLETIQATDVKLHKLYFKLDPIDGISGNVNITFIINDGTNAVVKVFSLVVNPVAALHGGWSNISSVGMKTDKKGGPVSEADIVCNYNKSTDLNKCDTTSGNCTGAAAPNGLVTPTAEKVLYYDSGNKRCYKSASTSKFSWTEIKTSCPITRATVVTGVCGGENCLYEDSPANEDISPTAKAQYYFDSLNNICYVSKDVDEDGFNDDTDWEAYSPAKITLAWNAFAITGSGADSSVYIDGWNVYRREAGKEYDFRGGHLTNAASTVAKTITDSSVRTFTDTTAIAGKVYYYIVRPVDSRHGLPTYTPEIISEVRIVAAPANYAFVHRWMANQEVCNSMNMTTSTPAPNKVDPTNNYRCPYKGPGETSGYYDIGKDMLVDTQEMGCAYSASPACTANGCVGISDPDSTLIGLSPNNVYYNRNSGSCFVYDGFSWYPASSASAAILTANNSKMNTALNPPLVNINAARAEAICGYRPSPSTSLINNSGLSNAVLPEKFEYIAYSAHPKELSDSVITDTEQGFSLNVQSRCNSSSASGIDSAYTDSIIPSTSYIYSIPGTASSGIRSVYTGSIPWVNNKSTEACVSRYGIQDLYGNVKEWVRDTMTCYYKGLGVAIGNEFTCSTLAATKMLHDMDPSGSTNYYGFDLTTGPFNDADASGTTSNDDQYLTEWSFAEQLFGAGKFIFPLALPVHSDISPSFIATLLDIGPGISTNRLHEDRIIINSQTIVDANDGGGPATEGNASIAVGGSYLSGTGAGRYTSELIPQDAGKVDAGFRCIIPIPNSGTLTTKYPSDPAHIYPY